MLNKKVMYIATSTERYIILLVDILYGPLLTRTSVNIFKSFNPEGANDFK